MDLADRPDRLRARWLRILESAAFLGVFSCLLAVQIFGPDAVGLADNQDFIRVTPDLGLTPNATPETRYFHYFIPDYFRGPPRPGIGWFYSERVIGRLAMGLDFADRARGHFNMRFTGLVHALLLAGCLGMLLFALRDSPWPARWIVPALFCWIFSDLMYSVYLNTFYGDALGFICLAAMTLSTWILLTETRADWAFLVFLAAGILFATAKPANPVNAALFGIFFGLGGWLRFRGARRMVAAGSGLALVAVSAGLVLAIPGQYSSPALINVLMLRIAKLPDAAQSMAHFGLPASDLKFAGKGAYFTGGPNSDPDFLARFQHVRAGSLMSWYFEHPAATLAFLKEDLRRAAPQLRNRFGYLPVKFGYVPLDRAARFAGWSTLRAATLRAWSWQIPAFFGGATVLGTALAFRGLEPRRRMFGAMLLLLTASAFLQFCVGSLLDAIETERHLFLFHTVTDLSILLLVCGALVNFAPLVNTKK